MTTTTDWLRRDATKERRFHADPTVFYPAILLEMQDANIVHGELVTEAGEPGPKLDRTSLEVAYRIAKWDAFAAMRAAVGKGATELIVSGAGKDIWGQQHHPKGPLDVDTQWKEIGRFAAQAYRRLRGREIPSPE